jgi:hypothetical protein
MRPAASLTAPSLIKCSGPSIFAGLAGRIALAVCFAQVIFLACCAAQDAPATFPVDGVVENSLTHQPVARALVESASDAILTDSQGHFELHLQAGLANLSVRRPGYEGEGDGRPPAQLNVNVSANTPPVTILLTPAASITGHVTLSSGDQAAGLQLILYRRQIEEGHSRWRSVGNAVTENDGAFRFSSLTAPASYILCTQTSPDSDGFTAPGDLTFGFPAACYPGGADLASAIATPLALAPGQPAQLEISITRQRFYPVSISVAGGTAGRLPFVQIYDRSGRPSNSSTSFNQNGTWEFVLPNGSYYAESHVWGDAPLYARLDFTVAGAPLSGLTLVPAPVAPIPVQIQEEFTANSDSTSNPAAAFNGLVSLDRAGTVTGDQPPIQISLDPVDLPLNGPMGFSLRPEPGSPGTYLLDSPSQGAYMLEVQAFQRQAYAASITSGSSDLLREPLIIGPGGSAQPIQITLRNDTGFLRCTAKADTASMPEQGAGSDQDAGSDQVAGPEESVGTNQGTARALPIPVYAISTGSEPHRIYFSYAQAAGLPAIPLPLPPGNYLVLAFENQQEIDIDDADAMSKLAAQGQTVTIQPGATLDLQVDPIRDGDVEAAQ